MLRAVLLGKIALAIVVCIVGSIFCFYTAGDEELTVGESVRWYGLSGFFVFVAICFVLVVYLLFKKKVPKAKSD